MIEETQFGKGAVRDEEDERDFPYDIVAAAAPIDWETGFDIRNYLGGDIKFKNQWSSSSCVGQGWSYYIWVLQVIEMMNKYSMTLEELRENHSEEIDDISAKAVYSQIFMSGGGASIRDGGKLVCNWGAVTDKLVPSNKPDGSTDESFMEDLTWRTNAIAEIAKMLKGKDYRVINAVSNMDLFAQAIIQNYGVVGGVAGENNGTWTSERPQPPERLGWNHCLYFGAFGTDEFGKFIAFPNSWGNLLGETWSKGDPIGYGWQKIYQSYFILNGQWLFNPWTFTDLSNKPTNNTMTNVKVIKDANSPAVGFWCPANNPDGLIAMARNYGIEVPTKPDGGVDWDKLIQGTMTLK